MKATRRSFTVAAAALLLAGCAGPQIFHGQLSALDKGMAPAEVASRLKLAPLSTHAAAAGARRFEFHKYRMNNGVYTDLYLLAYEQGQLLFWGYVSEFRRQPDAALNAALTSVFREIAAPTP